MIRNYNEAEALKKCLASVVMQATSASVEIVLLDNESTDDSVAVALSFGCKVFTLPKQEFTFGRALNVGIGHCTGEFVFLLSSHVVLLTPHFIEDFLIYLKDEKMGGMRFCISTVQSMILDENKPCRLSYSVLKESQNPHVILEYWMAYIVANCSVIRKSCWEMQPFDDQLIASEDKKWSLEILRKGFYLLYNVPCYYFYFKQITEKRYSHKYIIENVVMHQIGGLPQKTFAKILAGGFRIFAGTMRKAFVKSLRQVKSDLAVNREIKKLPEHHKSFL